MHCFNIGKYIFLHEKESVFAYYNIKKGTDKYFCQSVLKDGYDGFITLNPPINKENDPMFNYELTICSNNCSKVTFNDTCSPITYRYGSHAELLCNCDNSYYNLNCGVDYVVISDEISANNTIRQQIARERFEEQYKKRYMNDDDEEEEDYIYFFEHTRIFLSLLIFIVVCDDDDDDDDDVRPRIIIFILLPLYYIHLYH